MSSFTYNDDDVSFEDDCSRGLGAFEGLLSYEGVMEDSDMSSCLSDGDGATYRGMGFESNAFADDFHRGLSALGASPMSLRDLAPKPQPLAHKNIAVSQCAVPTQAPKLTEMAGFVSREQLYCNEVDVARIAQVIRAQCAAHDCAIDSSDKLQFTATHFSRAFLSLEFQVNVWNVADRSLCPKLLPHCLKRSVHMIEFHKLSGDAFRWKEFYAQLAGSIVEVADGFFLPSSYRPPMPQLDTNMLLDEELSPLDLQPCMSNMVHMLQGSHESQHAAVAALVQCCVTKETCDQLISSGFLQVAQTILHQVAVFKDCVPASQIPLLRCILLVISTVITCSEACKTAVARDVGMCQSVSALHLRNPKMFTRELAPLAQLVSSC